MAASAIAVLPAADAFPARWEPVDSHWVWGNLTWRSGSGGLEWNEAPSSDSLGGRGTTDSQSATGPEIFTSGPLGTPWYVNAGHLVQLDLLVSNAKGNPACPMAKLYAGPSLWAGGWERQDNYTVSTLQTVNPVPPDGFSFCFYRMPVEISYLPTGVRITLQLIYAEGSGPYAFGTSPSHPSILRVPVFSSEQAVYRMPEAIPRDHPGSGGDQARSGALGGLVAIASFGGFGLLAVLNAQSPGSRRQKGFLVALLLLPAVFAGCLGAASSHRDSNSEPTNRGEAVLSYEPAGGNSLGNNLSGSIVGQVRDSFQVPVSGAFVALLGTAHFTSTDADGLFSFRLIPAGAYRIRIDKQDYTGFEAEIDVRENQVTRTDVRLVYATGVDEGARVHRHDYWGDETEKVVLDKTIQATPCIYGDPCEDFSFFVPPSPDGDHNIIRPGTSEVEVVLTWTAQDLPYQRLALHVQSNEDSSPFNHTSFFPRRSGEPFHVKATWETTDVGHQLFSTWMFTTTAFDRATPPSDCKLGNDQCPHTLAKMHAKITIHRGSLPLEPAHPDHWKGREQLNLESGRTWWDTAGGYCFQGLPFTCRFQNTDSCYSSGPQFAQRQLWPIFGTPSRVVPQSTAQVVVRAVQTQANGLGQGLGTYGWQLWYKTGETPPETYDANPGVYKQASPGQVTTDGLSWTWHFPVTDKEADGTYNKKSAWSFFLQPDDQDAACTDERQDGGPGKITFSLEARKS